MEVLLSKAELNRLRQVELTIDELEWIAVQQRKREGYRPFLLLKRDVVGLRGGLNKWI